ncbi:MAG: hypothetical protein IJJ99_06605 [Oscillospiraceae bacterium]|nr:hypothetical protein [Oscillospiraceae bacterium]
MSEETKYLKLARAAREEENSEDAKKFYDMVRTDDPENGEAKFFYQYYSMYEGKNGELANRFVNLVKVLDPSVKFISQSNESESEKLAVIKAIVDVFTPLTWSNIRYMNNLTVKVGNTTEKVLPGSDFTLVQKSGVTGLYDLGDAIVKYFSRSPEAMKLALTPWKEGVFLQQKWCYILKNFNKSPEEYTAKIQKIEPSYTMPQKANWCANKPYDR